MIMDLKYYHHRSSKRWNAQKSNCSNTKKINAKRIIYVSCNSTTQSRDLELLKNKYHVIKFKQ